MKKQVLMAVVVFFAALCTNAQEKFFTKSGKIVFSSKAPLENIEAHHKSVTCVLDVKNRGITVCCANERV